MPSPTLPQGKTLNNPDELARNFEQLGYITDPALATAVYLAVSMGKPLLLEGHAGLGKTEIAKTLAAFLGTRLIRLQCYEGLDINSAVYEWNYQKQLLAIKIEERHRAFRRGKREAHFQPRFSDGAAAVAGDPGKRSFTGAVD